MRKALQEQVVISNIKAWEGAIAVATSEVDGRYGSHRYLTFVPLPDVVIARFVSFYLLSPEGLHFVGEASPGTADRNRTLNTNKLSEIMIPVPSYERQLWLDDLHVKIEAIRDLLSDAHAKLDALVPSFLDNAFR